MTSYPVLSNSASWRILTYGIPKERNTGCLASSSPVYCNVECRYLNAYVKPYSILRREVRTPTARKRAKGTPTHRSPLPPADCRTLPGSVKLAKILPKYNPAIYELLMMSSILNPRCEPLRSRFVSCKYLFIRNNITIFLFSSSA